MNSDWEFKEGINENQNGDQDNEGTLLGIVLFHKMKNQMSASFACVVHVSLMR